MNRQTIVIVEEEAEVRNKRWYNIGKSMTRRAAAYNAARNTEIKTDYPTPDMIKEMLKKKGL